MIKKHIKIITLAFIACVVVSIISLITVRGSSNKYKWEPGTTDFSLSYSSVGTMLQEEININISKNGDYEFIEYEGTSKVSDRKVINKHTAKLTSSEMAELFDYMINKNDFFRLKKNISKSNVTDASYDYLEVNFNGRTHRVGGYAASLDDSFSKACKIFHEINNKYIPRR